MSAESKTGDLSGLPEFRWVSARREALGYPQATHFVMLTIALHMDLGTLRSAVTQHELARMSRISLGMARSIVRWLVDVGEIALHRPDPHARYQYELVGFGEWHSRLGAYEQLGLCGALTHGAHPEATAPLLSWACRMPYGHDGPHEWTATRQQGGTR